jgi:hypothetical protein
MHKPPQKIQDLIEDAAPHIVNMPGYGVEPGFYLIEQRNKTNLYFVQEAQMVRVTTELLLSAENIKLIESVARRPDKGETAIVVVDKRENAHVVVMQFFTSIQVANTTGRKTYVN